MMSVGAAMRRAAMRAAVVSVLAGLAASGCSRTAPVPVGSGTETAPWSAGGTEAALGTEAGQPTLPVRTIRIKGHPLTVELAVTPRQQQTGLQERRELPPGSGMLFIFPDSRSDIVFWMDRTYIPLSLAFISRQGVIKQIEDMQPLSREHHRARFATKYVLEVNQGWFTRHQVGVGDEVDLSEIQ